LAAVDKFDSIVDGDGLEFLRVQWDGRNICDPLWLTVHRTDKKMRVVSAEVMSETSQLHLLFALQVA
jgi:hypothetical protein